MAARLDAAGGYPRTAATRSGATLLATSVPGASSARCELHLTRNARTWAALGGPSWQVTPSHDLSNCAPGEAPDGTLLVGVRHHVGAEAQPAQLGARPKRWAAASLFRIQVVRGPPAPMDVRVRAAGANGWQAPVDVYASTERAHAAWEPVFARSRDSHTLRVFYSLERPASWRPPACLSGARVVGAPLAPSAVSGPTASAALCQGRCVGTATCAAWSWRLLDGACALWARDGGLAVAADAEYRSGAKLCDVAADARSEGEGGGLVGASADTMSAERREQDIVLQESADGGRTWGPVRWVSRTEGSRDGMPSVGRQADGCLALVYEGFGGTGWGHFAAHAARSCDDGASWSHRLISPNASGVLAHAPTLAIERARGNATVAWQDGSHCARLQSSAAPLAGERPAAWSAPVPALPNGSAVSEWPQVFVDSTDSRLWMAFGDGAGRVRVTGPL
jgi:hypothetical protein